MPGIGLDNSFLNTLVEEKVVSMKVDCRIEDQRLHGLAFMLGDLLQTGFDFR